MRLLKRWRYLLIALVLVGIGGMAVAYVHSSGYRAAQAFARIQEGMTPDETRAIASQYGGEVVAIGYSGIRFVEWHEHSYRFGGRCYVHLRFPPLSELGPHCLVEKTLSRPTFTEWLSSFIDSLESRPQAYDSDPNERMQELLNESENLAQIGDERKRFWQIEQPIKPARSNE